MKTLNILSQLIVGFIIMLSLFVVAYTIIGVFKSVYTICWNIENSTWKSGWKIYLEIKNIKLKNNPDNLLGYFDERYH